MKKILESLAGQLPKYAAIASEIVEHRLKTFEEKIMERFAPSDTANPQAFADPDFQYLLGRSQQAYARSGDDETADILVDLIAQRSKQKERTRLALSINDAVERSALLTKNEFAELSLSFLIRYTRNSKTANFQMLVEHFRSQAEPLLRDISRERSSYSYIEAQSCASIEMGSVDLLKVLRDQYGGLLSLGVEREKFAQLLGENFEVDYPALTRVCGV
jgi:hypothetical protein